jgi:hypothetical protein
MNTTWKSVAFGALTLLSLGVGAQAGEGIRIRAGDPSFERAGFYDDCSRRRYIRAPDRDDCRRTRYGRRWRHDYNWDPFLGIHPIFARLYGSAYYDCRIVVTRRVNAWGALVVWRERICD